MDGWKDKRDILFYFEIKKDHQPVCFYFKKVKKKKYGNRTKKMKKKL